jgi:prevent-host-death family protein
MSYAQPISVKDFRDNLSTIIEEVAIGKKNYTITKFGKEKVAVIPVDQVRKVKYIKFIAKSPVFGMWKDRKDIENGISYVKKMRSSRLKNT